MTNAFTAPHFQNDKAARKFVEGIRWPDGPVCPHCGTIDHAYATKRAGVYRCAEKECRKDFTVTMRTVMERSHIAPAQVAHGLPPHDCQQERHERPPAPPHAWRHLQDRLVHGAPYPRSHARRWPQPRWAAKARSWKPTKPISARLRRRSVSTQRKRPPLHKQRQARPGRQARHRRAGRARRQRSHVPCCRWPTR